MPDGKISFQMFLGADDFTPDHHGNINRHGVITGGTGAYRNAGGVINHQTLANLDQEFILNFSN